MFEKIRKWLKEHSYKERCWKKHLDAGCSVCYGEMGGGECGLSTTCMDCEHLTIYIERSAYL